MALPMADASARWSPGITWRRMVEAVEAYPLERIGLAALAAGILLRLTAPFLMDFRSDGDTYVAMGHAWQMHHAFLMPYGDVTTWAPTPPGYSNHYPPAYPFYLGIVFTLFGYGLWQAKWAAVVVSLAALAVVYVTTRDLYGKIAAALAGGLLGLEPHLLWVTGSGFSENMVLLFFALTMWAIVRSLKDDKYIVLAGLFAALAYLSRASVGYFFAVAGAGGFLWRFYYRRWKLFTNYWYMLAIVVFLGVAVAWAIRNVSLFGFSQEHVTLLGQSWTVNVPLWETSSYTRYVQDQALQHPDLWRKALLAKIPLFLAFAAWYVIAFLPESWKATKRIREEETSALWLSVFLVFVIAWAIASMFWVFEKSSLYWLDNHRYVVIGLLPLGWLVVREARVERASFRARYVVMLVSLFIACAATIYSPVKFSDLRAAEHMDGYLQPGDEIAVDGGTIKYAFYAYLTHPEQVKVYGWGTEGYHPQFIVSLKGEWNWDKKLNVCQAYEGYELVGAFHQHFWTSGVMTACLHATPEVIAARGIQTGIVVIDG
ncbi:MAG TPA: glycosyltransferase family 39 protein [Candidatus Thermoplasmatota archaeon]|nr:glycosyltransferase family 39 protein [Candidatus Thermoplasmatota archaeon]